LLIMVDADLGSCFRILMTECIGDVEEGSSS
jgi:hypothetical protein